jgi:hypothetical protein
MGGPDSLVTVLLSAWKAIHAYKSLSGHTQGLLSFLPGLVKGIWYIMPIMKAYTDNGIGLFIRTSEIT